MMCACFEVPDFLNLTGFWSGQQLRGIAEDICEHVQCRLGSFWKERLCSTELCDIREETWCIEPILVL
jgi:hypothetical protein